MYSERRWATNALLWTLGGWFFLTLGMIFLAVGNFRVMTPDRLRDAEVVFEPIAEGETRALALKYVASELNRYFFTAYGWGHLGLATLAVTLLLLSGRGSRWRTGSILACFVIALFFSLYMIPTITEIGREIDFMPRDPKPPLVKKFDLLHHADEALEVLKLVLIGAVSLSLVRSRKAVPSP